MRSCQVCEARIHGGGLDMQERKLCIDRKKKRCNDEAEGISVGGGLPVLGGESRGTGGKVWLQGHERYYRR